MNKVNFLNGFAHTIITRCLSSIASPCSLVVQHFGAYYSIIQAIFLLEK